MLVFLLWWCFHPNVLPSLLNIGAQYADGSPFILELLHFPIIIHICEILGSDLRKDSKDSDCLKRLIWEPFQKIISFSFVSNDINQLMSFSLNAKVGEKLGRFEVEKRRAVEIEDYDLAKAKKVKGLAITLWNKDSTILIWFCGLTLLCPKLYHCFNEWKFRFIQLSSQSKTSDNGKNCFTQVLFKTCAS